jgi:hypothetical protein
MWPNVRTGLAYGLGLATVLSCIVLVLVAVRGPQALRSYGIGLPLMLLGYYVSGVLGGAVVGLLLPLARWPLGAALVGVIAGSIVYALAGWLVTGQGERAAVLPGLTLIGAAVGAAVGVGLWYGERYLQSLEDRAYKPHGRPKGGAR